MKPNSMLIDPEHIDERQRAGGAGLSHPDHPGKPGGEAMPSPFGPFQVPVDPWDVDYGSIRDAAGAIR